MAKSLKQLPELLKDIDLVIEARDSRLPLTSVNPAFEQAIEESWGRVNSSSVSVSGTNTNTSMGKGKGKEIQPSSLQNQRERLVVYTKKDLGEQQLEEPLKSAFLKHAGQRILFADSRKDSDVRRVLRYAVGECRGNCLVFFFLLLFFSVLYLRIFWFFVFNSLRVLFGGN